MRKQQGIRSIIHGIAVLPAVMVIMTAMGMEAACAANQETSPAVPVLELMDGGPGRCHIKITAPDIPDAVSVVWLYEGRVWNEAPFEYETLPDGRLLVRHDLEDRQAETVLTPLPGAVDIELTMPEITERRLVGHANSCWQFSVSDSFGNRGVFPEDFAQRCFIFTVRGFTLLGDTVRFAWARPGRAFDHEHNNPPWVQLYQFLSRRHRGNELGSPGNSTDRMVLPILGVVSRDGRYLQAWAWERPLPSADMGQFWMHCLHTRPRLTPDPAAGVSRARSRIYIMENDPDKLVASYLRDFGADNMGPAPTITAQEGNLVLRWPDHPDDPLVLTLPAHLAVWMCPHSKDRLGNRRPGEPFMPAGSRWATRRVPAISGSIPDRILWRSM